jgi:hypothetical protein
LFGNAEHDLLGKIVRKSNVEKQELLEKLARAERLIADLQGDPHFDRSGDRRVIAVEEEAPEDEKYYPGTKRRQRFVPRPTFLDPEDFEEFPIFRVMNEAGSGLIEGAEDDPVLFDRELSMRMYQQMARIEAMDDIFFNAQRQGTTSVSLPADVVL